MYKECIICESSSDELVLNDLLMRKCQECGLIWRQSFNLPLQHYEEKDRDLSSGKQERRLANCKNRARTFGKYVDLNNLCDVGCGEGMFLKVLQDLGYKNVRGIEPSRSDKYAEFARENNLNIQKDTIKDIGSIINSHNIHTITMFHVIEHLENPLESLKIIYDNLAPGSWVVIEAPNTEAHSLLKSNYKHELLIYPEHFFYFNESNLEALLEKIGFHVITKGKRDFNPESNLNISESLFRLGVLRKNIHAKKYKSTIESDGLNSSRFKNSLIDKVKNIIRFILTKMVIILGRQDFMWIIARK
jgi:2-polyprenyl-3-methyl-5-hydroxy-6-metoxy-1,4-benzoquinol methylase